jgi:hypothetical protein
MVVVYNVYKLRGSTAFHQKQRVQKCALPAKLAGRMVSESPQKLCSLETVRHVQAIKPKIL